MLFAVRDERALERIVAPKFGGGVSGGNYGGCFFSFSRVQSSERAHGRQEEEQHQEYKDIPYGKGTFFCLGLLSYQASRPVHLNRGFGEGRAGSDAGWTLFEVSASLPFRVVLRAGEKGER